IDDARGYDTTLSTEQIKTAEKEITNIKRLNTARKQNRALEAQIILPNAETSITKQQEQEQPKNSFKNDIQQTPSNRETKTDNSSTPSNNISLDLSNTAEQQLAIAVAQLNNAKTPNQYASAMLAVSKAQIALEKEKNANE